MSKRAKPASVGTSQFMIGYDSSTDTFLIRFAFSDGTQLTTEVGEQEVLLGVRSCCAAFLHAVSCRAQRRQEGSSTMGIPEWWADAMGQLLEHVAAGADAIEAFRPDPRQLYSYLCAAALAHAKSWQLSPVDAVQGFMRLSRATFPELTIVETLHENKSEMN